MFQPRRPDIEANEAFFQRLAENSPIGIYLVQDGVFRFVNREFEKCTEFPRRALIGRDCLSLIHPQDRDMVREAAEAMLQGERTVPYEYRVISATGKTVWILETVTSVTYGGEQAAAGNFMNITERKTLEEKLREQARRDSLTGLLNHGAILEELQDLIFTEREQQHAVVLADVDNLKDVNDEHGHQTGDAVLNAVAEALQFDGAIVGRYGGDEFVAVLPILEAERLSAYKKHVRHALARAQIADVQTGAPVATSMTLGTAIYPLDGKSVTRLISVADAAMYRQRRQVA